MNRFFMIIVFMGLVTFTGCEETPEPTDPCEDTQWATATRNGEDHCMGNVEVTYWNANTTSAKVILSARNDESLTPEINAAFSIPVEGVMLNTAYPVLEGKIFGADEITEGSLTLLVFDPPAQGKAGCIAGTFTLKSQSGGISTFEYTDGKFAYFKGEGTELTGSTEFCNPF
ncbi:hypothetical protein [Marinoscillum sp.]|uniref:hypothetical protein n=1 Tax=Marinoscillum sp. TaxID=2024838 RepID=UPI003BAC5A67